MRSLRFFQMIKVCENQINLKDFCGIYNFKQISKPISLWYYYKKQKSFQ